MTHHKNMTKQERRLISQICHDTYNTYIKTPTLPQCTIHYCCFIRYGRSKRQREQISIGSSKLIEQYNTPTLHAEIDAFRKLPNYYMNYSLNMIVLRFTKEGNLSSSRPCFHCLRTLSDANINIKYVYYSNQNQIHKEHFKNMLDSNQTIMSSGMRNRSEFE